MLSLNAVNYARRSFQLSQRAIGRQLKSRQRYPQQRRRPYSSSPPDLPTPQAPNLTRKATPPASELSSSASNSSSSSSASPATKEASRLTRLHARLPRFLQPYTKRLLNAPVSHVAAFLILHELTAIVPLFGFGYWFYKSEKLPWFADGAYFDEGVRRAGKYLRRKGWLGANDQEKIDKIEKERTGQGLDEDAMASRESGNSEAVGLGRWINWKSQSKGGEDAPTRREKWWGRGEDGVHLVSSFAAAYALTKILLPARIILSIWATPFAARVAVVPVTTWATSKLGRALSVLRKKGN